ncbi:MAG TPA: putative manganese-dependent inorganic diphosphatase [Terrimicrobiaceae bacterium]|jgi:manganese-dependent inorganic pyrophosphatase|nr:putative manganese-dependent inorganic diphosphatase [Terrimicrobiaceae bacterium]
MQTIVIGHKNPDMDSICSAIGYAELKKAIGENNVRAARCGNTNQRIDYALKKFGYEAPLFITSVRPRVEDVMNRDVLSVGPEEPVYEAFTRIGQNGLRGLPVVEKSARCVGLISTFKITQYLFPPRDKIGLHREVRTALKEVIETIGGALLAGTPESDIRHFTLIVAAMELESFKRRLGSLDNQKAILIVGDRHDIQRLAIEQKVHAVIVTGGLKVDEEILRAADERGTVIISSPHDTATTVLLARSSVRAGEMLDDDIVSLAPETPLVEAQRDLALSSQFAFPVLDQHRNLRGILAKGDFLKPIPRQLILVDHNELSQAVDGADLVPIAEILDHHRIGAPPTESPILFLNRPVGSTSTIVGTLFQQAGVPISKNLAGLLMCGMISDTLNLTSPTTTDVDRALMGELSALSGIDPAALASEIFSVGSPLQTMTPDEAVTADSKEYDHGSEKYTVAQIEELSFAPFNAKREALLEALEALRAAKGYLFAALLITDINTQNSILLVRGDPSFTRLIDYPEAGEYGWRLDGVVSRKKQLLPYLTGLLARMA